MFAVKASRYLTHMKRLRDIGDGVARFWEPLEPLRRSRRLGPVLWQLPENFERDDDLLGEALGGAAGRSLLRVPAPELVPRRRCGSCLRSTGRRWRSGTTSGARCRMRSRSGSSPICRLHYGHRGRGGNYSEAELDEWRRRIAAWRSRRSVFVYLNNDWKGYAPANARYLRRGLS